jgi:ABC-type branched-subunit amino acid transport system ATPase component
MEECRGRYRHRRSEQIVRIGLARSAAVRRVGWPVPDASGGGEIFGFLGPNGAGKTTTLKILLRARPRDERDAHCLLGQPAGDVATRGRIGFLPESPYFYDYLTAEEFLGFYGQLAGLDRAVDQSAGDGSVAARRACGGAHEAVAEILQRACCNGSAWHRR